MTKNILIEAYESINSKNYEKTIQLCKIASLKDPTEPLIQLLRHFAAKAKGDEDIAAKAYTRYVELKKEENRQTIN